MSLQLQSLPIDDFSGGKTDYILDAAANQAETLENFVINPNKKLDMAVGSVIFDETMYQIPDGVQRVTSVFATSTPDLLIGSGRKLWRPNTSAFAELLGPTSNPAFSAGATSDFNSFAEWNDHVFAVNSAFSQPIKIYKDGSGIYQVRTAGMPDLASSPSVTSAGGTGNNFIYAFHYYYQYTVGTVQYEDYGPTTLVELANVGHPTSHTISITTIPALANGSTLNYDTANIKVFIYRTVTNGSVLYKIGEVTNGTTVFTDNFSDASIQNNLLLYTNTGVLENDPPPQAKYIHVVNGVAIYGHIKEGTEVFKNRVRQSVQDDLDSCPRELYVDLLDEVVGLSSFNDNPIVFTKGHVYRLNGAYNELGQGQVTFEDITKTIGCMSHNSIVQTRFGVFWAGDDGFYWTDGFQFKKISDSLNESYKNLVSSDTRKSRIYGAFDSTDNRVYWACTYEDSSTDNDTFYILDLRWGIRDASTFTTRTNGTDFAPTAITFYNGDLIRADRRGYIFKHNQNYSTDPKVDTLTTPDLWPTKVITPIYKSPVINFGLPYVRKWVPKILLTLENITNTSVQIVSINDNTSAEVDLKEIRFRGNYLWGDPAPIWGNDLPQWDYSNLIEEMRRFPATTLRSSYKQIIVTQSFTNIYNSDSVSTATVNTTAKTATLTDVDVSWPTDIVDYFITFDTDNYTKEYLITARNSDTVLTYLDALNTSSNTASKWLIRGYPKGEIINILSYILYFAPITSQSYKTWRNEQDSTGGNA